MVSKDGSQYVGVLEPRVSFSGSDIMAVRMFTYLYIYIHVFVYVYVHVVRRSTCMSSRASKVGIQTSPGVVLMCRYGGFQDLEAAFREPTSLYIGV